MPETGSVRFGSTTIPYVIVRSRRRKKTIEITLDPAEGVLVSAPAQLPSGDVARVVRKRAGWIVRKTTEAMLHPRPKQFISGESLPYLGRQVRIFVQHAPVRRVELAFNHWSFRIKVPAHLQRDARRRAILRAVQAWYRKRALERLRTRVGRWASATGATASTVLVRDQRQRWGSCGPDGTLRFNWRVIMADLALIDYVVVHELLHLRVRNHSREFWTEMARLLPDFKVRRARLKEFGASIAI